MKKFKLKVGLDVDDVLFECNAYAVALANQKYHFSPPLTINEITKWGQRGDRSDVIFEFYKQEGFFEKQPVIEGAHEFIKELSQMAEVFFVSAVAPEIMSIRAERLRHEFPEIPSENIILGSRKDIINLDVFLDDGAHNVISSESAYPVLMRRPWNQHMTGCLAVNNYNEFLTLIRSILDSYGRFTANEPGHKIYALVGPSASGKTAIMYRLLEDTPDVFRNISFTTRERRKGEVRGVDYHFVEKEVFAAMEKQGCFFESTRYAGDCYGSCKDDVEALLKKGDVIMATDICGAIALKHHFPGKSVSVFVKRPKEELVHAILERDCSNEEKTRRILSLSDEYKNEDICDATIDNVGTIDEAVDILRKIMGRQ